MAKVNMIAYTLLRWFFEFCIHMFYGNVSARGTENIPKDRPVIFVVNHYNGLVDALFLYSEVSNRLIRGVAKQELFNLPVVGFFMKLLGIIPIIRPCDVNGKDLEEQRKLSNLAAINAMAEVLIDGHCIVIFPEGTSHNNSDILTIKTGFARAAFTCLEKCENLDKIYLVPVGLNYDSKNEFRSDVYVQFGKEIPIDRNDLQEYQQDSGKTLHRLADVVKDALRNVTVVAKEPDTILAAQVARSLVRNRSFPLTQEEYLLITQRFIDLFENEPEAKPVYETLKQFNAHIRLLNMKYYEISMKYSFVRKIITLLFTLPICLPGSLYHGPIGLLCSHLGKKLAAGYKDQEAHYKLMIVISLLPIYYLITIGILTYLFSFYFALYCALLLAISGILAVRIRPVAVSLQIMKSLGKLLVINREEILKVQRQIRNDLAPLVGKHCQDLIKLNLFDTEIVAKSESSIKQN
ncbi:predicted protein [Naegleria gruberi]|uniref:Predicted protein n=1 Tax=Naegleria gruberi TaxID=5762 RepID=D2VTZ6_NAEGR|nr:uncharacterized protein NAEGRDRAFT_72483 [Naegleria gruberi]EFC39745.1 predicted protein [Naegleria gruberi]|eukprot:XP_002672489.1 predicted protein [Naegleria gruberi strain NEG-M]